MIHFVDIETLGLDPTRHTLFEIAVAQDWGEPTSFWIEPSPDELSRADSGALRLTDFYARRTKAQDRTSWGEMDDQISGWCHGDVHVNWGSRSGFAYALAAHLTDHIAGNCISFDALRIETWLRYHGTAPRWHYHLVDVEAYAAGVLGLEPPWKSKEISEALGVLVPVDQHQAAADVIWSQALYRGAKDFREAHFNVC